MEPILKYPGAKWRLAEWIISHFPPHITYLEPYFGSGAVFFKKPPSHIETINDIDADVINFFTVLRDYREELAGRIEATAWSRDEYYLSYHKTGDPIEDARRYAVRCWQAFGTKTSDRTGWRNDLQARGAMYLLRQWNRLPYQLVKVAERIKQAQIENQPAVKLIKRYKFSEVLIYADPPYLDSTKTNRLYAHEMTPKEHMDLLEVLNEHPGPAMLSAYPNEMYNAMLKDWEQRTTPATTDGGKQRTEVLWLNRVAAKATQGLF